MFGLGKNKKEKKRVLVVEDDAMVASVLIDRLGLENYDASNVNNGLDVIEQAKKYNPHIILLDLILPGLDGFEVLKQLKSETKTKQIPVFVISNLDSLPDVKSIKALGAEEYFIKANVKMEKIIEAIKKKIK